MPELQDFYGWYFAAATFVFGLALGSFLNVCIYRLPRGLSVVSPRSACPNCHNPIAAYDNIPVLSWLLLRGKCRDCKEPISGRYAIIELFTGLLFLACYYRFGGLSLATVAACTFSFLTLGLIFTDAETHLLPDAMTFPGMGLGLIFSLLVPLDGFLELRYALDSTFADWWQSHRLLSLADSLIGALIGAGMIWIVGEAYFRLRGIEGMGLGDVKLMAMVGVFLGAQGAVFVLFTASLAGAAYGTTLLAMVYRKRMGRYSRLKRPKASSRAFASASLAMRYLEMPFGVFLGGMALVYLFYGKAVIHWYLGLYA